VFVFYSLSIGQFDHVEAAYKERTDGNFLEKNAV